MFISNRRINGLGLWIACCLLLFNTWSSKLPGMAAESQATASEATIEALRMVSAGEVEKARAVLLDASKSARTDVESRYFLAAIDHSENNFASAVRYLYEVQVIQSLSGAASGVRQILVSKRIADCLYKSGDTRASLQQYKQTQALCAKYGLTTGVICEEVLEAIVGANLELKDFAAAESNACALVDAANTRFQKDPTAIVNVVWSQLQLADVYRDFKQSDKEETVRQSLRPLLTKLVEMRMDEQNADGPDSFEALVQRFREHYINELQPKTPADLIWAATDFRVRTLPVIGWKCISGKPLASIICIHGLGLENRAFQATARELNKRGYDVYALDVRGFGAWTQTKGMEDLDYVQTIKEIGRIAQIVKEKTNGLPVIVLGESMGGAIALRAGASLSNQIDGVISSVPSAERFQQKKMTLQTALHFLKGPKKAFDVGYVVEMATTSASMQNQWKDDPKARLRLTPIELAEFAVFMRKTKPQVEKITTLPVLVLQGLKDKLVKPEGTFSLFDAVSSEDKTLLIIGTAEHLMFENPSPDRMLMDTVDSWLKTLLERRFKQPE